MKATLLHIGSIIRDLWNAPEEQFIWLINLLLPQILFLVALWLVFRWMWRKAYPPKDKKAKT